MAKLALVVNQNKGLSPHSPSDEELIRNKRVGTLLEVDFKTVRNPDFHRKYMALLRLGFDYWTPTGGTITYRERDLVTKFVRWIGRLIGQQSTLEQLAQQFLQQIANKRADYEVEKCFDTYRKEVAIDSGYYKVVALPNGTVKKEATSISFAKMDDDQFQSLYKSSFNTIWNQVLQYHFDTKKDAYNATQQMLQYI